MKMRKTMKALASTMVVGAAICCGCASGILPSGQMNSRSLGRAGGVSAPNEAQSDDTAAPAANNSTFLFIANFPILVFGLHPGRHLAYTISMQSPYEKKRYSLRTANAYAHNIRSRPASADTIISSVDCGRWKLVSMASQTLNS